MLKQVTIQDLELLYHIETTCFPIQEAASYQSLKERLAVYHEGFEIFYIAHQAIGYIGGLRNNECNLPDSMYENAFLHQENGKYQMIFSVCILPEYRGHGYAREMVKEYVEKRKNDVDELVNAFSIMTAELKQNLNEATRQKRQIETILLHMTDGFILTCKDHLIPFYESCGFKFVKVSASTHGNAKWNDMVIDCRGEI